MSIPSFRIPLRFLRARDGRTALTVIALALGVALVCSLDLVTRSMQLAFEEVIDTMAGRAALEVTAGDGGLVPAELSARLRDVPGVELAVPVVRATAFTSDDGEALTVHGIDFLNEDALRVYEGGGAAEPLIDDPVRFLANPRAVVLTRSFAERRGLREDDEIQLDTPRGRQTFSVLRLLDPQGIARVHGGNLVVMDVGAAEDAFTERGLVSHIDVVVARDANTDTVRRTIEHNLPSGLRVVSPSQRKVDLQSVMRSFGVLLRAIGLAGLLVAYLIAFNGVSSGFERRSWQLGVLAAIGARPSAIWREQMKEALLIGLASVAIGLCLGFALARVVLPVIATATALNFNLIAPQVRIVPSIQSLVMAVGLGIGVTLLAAWLPAARAVRSGISSSIRRRDREALSGRDPASWRLPIGFCAAAACAAILQWWIRSPTFGLVATGLIAVAIACSATPLVCSVARGVGPALVAIAGPSGRLAATGLRDHPRRVGLTTATIGVGIGAVVWLGILARSFESSVVDVLGRAIRADLVVTSTNIGSGFLEAPLHADALSALRAVPGVQAAAGWRALEWPYGAESIGLSAYDPSYFVDRRFGEWPLKAATVPDAWERVADGQGVVVSTSFVTSFGKTVGDGLDLDTPTGRLTLPIVGVTVDFVSPRGTVEISRDVFAQRWRDTSVTRAFVLKDTEVDPGELRRRIGVALGSRFRLRVLSAGELMDYFSSQVRRAFSVVPVFAGTVYLVILVGLASSLTTSVLDGRRELAIVRAIGLRPRLAGRVVVLESLAIGCIGLVLAGIGGVALAMLWTEGTFQLLLGWALQVEIPFTALFVLAAATLVVCYAASYIPARRAEALEVADVLRYE